ncbi:hypothetical protein [Actinacidiphila sp. ITFR-21]|uniref:hypothetical protein n=1 Tax=Actinacidiphila sp. ITFR-21 TaxID=3075199 RepID=UPI00288942F0|nr:hypothetical protein [Streptomyces sp. ITFR-21]WNI17296.1 hypothetical protein RLT57_18425 [Streptomyces sp. ITFR-21]
MTERAGQQPPKDPRPTEGGREVLEGRVIPSPAQAQRQYDARQPPQAAPHGDPRQQYAAPPPAGPQAPGAGPAWSPQQQPQGGAAQQQGPGTDPQAYTRQPPAQGPQGAPGPEPRQGPPVRQPAPGTPGTPGTPPGAAAGFGGQAEAFQQRMRRIRQAAAEEEAAAAEAATAAGGPGTPDWTALADRQAAADARRRRVAKLVGGVVAVAVVAGGVAAAVVLSGRSSDDTAGPSASATGTASQLPLPPAPSFSPVAPPPPPNPLDYLGTAAKDTAPLTADTLFPGKQFLMNGRAYVKTATSVTVNCASAARDDVAAGLAANGCTRLVRATYTNGGLAVTVGVAVFADSQHAVKLQKTAKYLAPLNGGGVRDFCHAVACQMTSNAVGRYAYFAIAGLKNGKTLTPADTVAKQAANEASNFAFQRIVQRGRDAAAADPNAG